MNKRVLMYIFAFFYFIQAFLSPGIAYAQIVGGECGDDELNTAIGCIGGLVSKNENAGPETFLGTLLKWGIGIGGGIAFILIVYAGFMIMTAAGNPERLKAGQELLTSAISGLVLLIFSVFVLNFIGVDLLGLGAFGFGK